MTRVHQIAELIAEVTAMMQEMTADERIDFLRAIPFCQFCGEPKEAGAICYCMRDD